jgi:hypothetical protein
MHEREWVAELICVQATGLPSQEPALIIESTLAISVAAESPV